MKTMYLGITGILFLASISFAAPAVQAVTFTDLSTIAKDSGFQGRIQYAYVVAAIAVISEDVATQNHAQRIIFASKILRGDVNVFQLTLGVLTNSTIASEATTSGSPTYSIPDGDIQFTVNSLFGVYAGI